MRVLLAEQMELPEVAWAKLNWSWIGFFVFMGIANLFVAFNFSPTTGSTSNCSAPPG
jgi:intracellular septation protein